MRSIFATPADCKAISGANIPPNQICTIVQLGQVSLGVASIGRADFIYDPASTASDALEQMVITPGAGTGRWLRLQKFFDVKVPVGFALTNNATLITVPVGYYLTTERPFLEVTTNFSGGVVSAIGVSASVTGFSSAGDLLGGAAGELAAALTVGNRGKLGTALAASLAGTGQPFALVAGDVVRWNLIASQFTAGAGFLHFPAMSLAL